MTIAQTAMTLYPWLKSIIKGLPNSPSRVEIVLPGYQKPVRVVFAVLEDMKYVRKYYRYLISPSGRTMMSEEFYDLAKGPMKLPDEVISFKITLNTEEIVTTHIECATPIGSLDFLKGYKIDDPKRNVIDVLK